MPDVSKSFALAALVIAGAALALSPLVVGRFSRGEPGGPLPSEWTPLTFPHIPRHTEYSAEERPLIAWRWKADSLIARGDVHSKDGDDFPVRIYVSFRYSPERLSWVERIKYAAFRAVYGEYPPHAGAGAKPMPVRKLHA